ncbi:MAG TPA: adenylosuccinate lyase, partial [bacterium]|nr:adenylosuccinate lyase [bacterium]
THSSVERVIAPDATTVLDYMIRKLTGVIEGLRVYPEHMRINLERTGGLVFSHRVLLALLDKGLPRDEAYRIVQTAAMRAWEGGGVFSDLIRASGMLTDGELRACFDASHALRYVDTIFARTGLDAAGAEPVPAPSMGGRHA